MDYSRLGESEAFGALVDRLQKIRSQLVVGFVDGQVELIETERRDAISFIENLASKLPAAEAGTHHVCADGNRSVERSSR